MKNPNKLILTLVAALVIAGAGFAGGMTYAKATVKGGSQFARGAGAGGPGGAAGRTSGFRANNMNGVVAGTVIASDDKSVTVQLRDGGSKIVYFSAKTQVLKSVDGAITDLVKDANVTVIGTAGTDGTITAQSIQIRPAGMQAPFGGRQ